MAQVKVDITGDNTGLIAALEASKAAMAEAAEQMAASFEVVSNAFETVQTAMVGITAILAGGKAFGEAIQASAGAAYAALELGRQLGTTATQASVLKVAMDENFVSTEAVSGASSKIAQTLKTNEAAFTNLGVATRDSNGNFRDSFAIMQDVNTKLAGFKEGTDRNVEGMKIYGRSWLEVMDAIRITGPAMEEAKAKADSLGLTVGKEGVEQAMAYKTAMAGVGTVFDALEKVIGDALVPILTSLGQWFEGEGPKAVGVMRAAVYSVDAAFSGFKEGVTVVADFIAGAVDNLVAHFMRFTSTADRALHFDFSGASAAWAQGTADIEQKSKFMSDAIAQDMKEATDARRKFFESQDAPQTAIQGSGGNASTGDDQMKSQMAKFEAALAQQRADWQTQQGAHGSYIEFSKQQELDYWQGLIQDHKAKGNDIIAIEKQIANTQVAIQKQGFEGELANLKNEEAANKDSLQMRLTIEYQYAAKVLQAYGAESKEYAEAQKAIIATKQASVDQQRQADQIRADSARTAALNEIQVEEDAAKLKYDNGRLSLDQYIALQQEFENKKFAIKQQEIQKEIALEELGPDNPAKKAQLDAQLQTLESTHQAAMFKIQQQQIQESTALYKSFTDKLASSFTTAFASVIEGTKTLGQAFRSMFSTLLQTVVQSIAQMASKMLVQHLIAMAQNKEEASSNAAVAATGAAKSAADIPYVGWALAIGAAASVFSAASSYSAAGGFDVPSGINPVTQLHSKEMVLPAPLADRVRGMTEGGDTSGTNTGGPVHLHLHGTRYGNMFAAHEDDLVKTIKSATRKGKLG